GAEDHRQGRIAQVPGQRLDRQRGRRQGVEVQQVIRRRRRGEAGFSFIEVVIASLLLLMIAVAVLPMFTEAAASNEVGKEYTDVANFARSRAEEFTQLAFNAEPLTITANTSRVHDETYLAVAKKWITGTT